MSNYNYSFTKAFSSRLIATLLSLAILVGVFPGAFITAEAAVDMREIPDWITVISSGPNFVYFTIDWDMAETDSLFLIGDTLTSARAAFECSVSASEWNTNAAPSPVNFLDSDNGEQQHLTKADGIRYVSLIVEGGARVRMSKDSSMTDSFTLITGTEDYVWRYGDNANLWTEYLNACGVTKSGSTNPLGLVCMETDTADDVSEKINTYLSHLPHGNWAHARKDLWISAHAKDDSTKPVSVVQSGRNYIVTGEIEQEGKGCGVCGKGSTDISWTIPIKTALPTLTMSEGQATVKNWDDTLKCSVTDDRGILHYIPSDTRVTTGLTPGSTIGFYVEPASGGNRTFVKNYTVPSSTYRLRYNANSSDSKIKKGVTSDEMISGAMTYTYELDDSGNLVDKTVGAGVIKSGDDLFERPGYTFKGWSTTSNQSDEVISGGNVTSTYIPANKLDMAKQSMLSDNTYGKVTDLYAIWEGQDYDLTYLITALPAIPCRKFYSIIEPYSLLKPFC